MEIDLTLQAKGGEGLGDSSLSFCCEESKGREVSANWGYRMFEYLVTIKMFFRWSKFLYLVDNSSRGFFSMTYVYFFFSFVSSKDLVSAHIN